MTFVNRMDDRQLQCQRRMLRLRVLAVSQEAVTPTRQAAGIRDATNAVISEVETMSRAALESSARKPGAETFLWVRVSRLAMAADDAVNASRRGDLAALNAHLRHFDTLLTAIWTVQDTVYGHEPVTRRQALPV
jgi:hypothetical protein